MEWLKRMEEAICYIEDNIYEPFDIKSISKVAYSSTFHFQRMFTMITGITVGEYFRKRKLTVAAQELVVSNSKVIDIALKYGYSSPESFSKAFKKLHGINPKDTKKQNNKLYAYPRISFSLTIKGGEKMDYKIIKKEAFTIVGAAKNISIKDEQNFVEIPKFWEEKTNSDLFEKLAPYRINTQTLGVCLEFEKDIEEFTYMIAVESEKEARDSSLHSKIVPASTWAIFSGEGKMPQSLQDLVKRIYNEWFPSTKYEHAGTAELEVYKDMDEKTGIHTFELWIPIIKKD